MRKLIFLLASVLWSSYTLADVPITITGTIMEPVCMVTGNDGSTTVEVKFGEVALDDVGSAAAEQPIYLKVSCDSPVPVGKSLNMFVHSTGNGKLTTLGSNVLGTSQSNLGIALSSSSEGLTPVDLDTWVPITGIDTSANKPQGEVQLKARLVTQSVSLLVAGGFTASANLIVSYQ